MAQEKTEKATPRRRRKAREEGQVAKSREMTMAIALLLVLGYLFLAFPLGLQAFQDFMHFSLTGDLVWEFTIGNIHRRLLEAMSTFAIIIIPTLMVAAMAGLLAELLQVGFMFTTKLLAPRLDRLDPIKGMQRVFSKRALVELVKALLKAVIFAGVSYLILAPALPVITMLSELPLMDALGEIGGIIIKIGLFSAFFQIIMGAADYMYQRWEFEQKLRMSKQDIKDEYKETEGDPTVQSRIKERQREMAKQRMMQEVPDADVVITNPTHIAVAIKYNQAEMAAPQVVAKGTGEVAQRIVALAREHKVEIVQERALAQALFRSTEVGEEIPADLYQVVAEVLAFVYRLQKYF